MLDAAEKKLTVTSKSTLWSPTCPPSSPNIGGEWPTFASSSGGGCALHYGACAPVAQGGRGLPKSRADKVDHSGQVWQLKHVKHVGHQ